MYKISLLCSTRWPSLTGKLKDGSTVDSHYLEVQGTLWIISRYPYLDISDLQNWVNNKSNNHMAQVNMYLNTEVKEILEQCLLFSTILCYLLLDFHVKTGTRFSLWDKRLFKISEVEIMRINCISVQFDTFLFLYKMYVVMLDAQAGTRNVTHCIFFH